MKALLTRIAILLLTITAAYADGAWQGVHMQPGIKIAKAVTDDNINMMSYWWSYDYGCISYSADGGHTWEKRYSDTSAYPQGYPYFKDVIRMSDICMRDGKCFFLLDSGRIKYTADYGKTIDSVQLYDFRHEGGRFLHNDKYIMAVYSIEYFLTGQEQDTFYKIIMSEDNFQTSREIELGKYVKTRQSACSFELKDDFLYILWHDTDKKNSMLTRCDIPAHTFKTWSFPYRYSISMARSIGEDSILAYYVDMEEYDKQPSLPHGYLSLIELKDDGNHTYGTRKPYESRMKVPAIDLFSIGLRYYFSHSWYDKETGRTGRLIEDSEGDCTGREYDRITYRDGKIIIPDTSGECLLINDNFTSVKTPPAGKEVFVFPNPASDILNLETGTELGQEVYFYNMTGERIFPQPIGENSFDISTLPAGIYTALIRNSESTRPIKFMKD